MKLKVVHLVPGHIFSDIAQRLQRKGPPADVQHKATHRILWIIPDLSARHAPLPAALPQNLQDGSGGPINAIGMRGGNQHRFADFHTVALLAEKRLSFLQGQIKITALGRIRIADGKPHSHDILIILLKFLCHGGQIVLCSGRDGDCRRLGRSKPAAVGAMPLRKLRDDCGLFVRWLCMINAGNPNWIVAGDGLLPCGGIGYPKGQQNLLLRERRINLQILSNDLRNICSVECKAVGVRRRNLDSPFGSDIGNRNVKRPAGYTGFLSTHGFTPNLVLILVNIAWLWIKRNCFCVDLRLNRAGLAQKKRAAKCASFTFCNAPYLIIWVLEQSRFS